MSGRVTLEGAILNWARSQIEPGQVSAWPLRARAESVDHGSRAEIGLWVHVHDGYRWICSIKRTAKAGEITVFVQDGVRVRVEEGNAP